MRFRRTKALLAAAGLALSLAACGGGDDGGADVEVKAADNLTGVPKQLSDDGKIKIGVKFDQPGISFKEPGSDAPVGFDDEIGKIVAANLGIGESDIEWVETVSDNRETFIKDGTVDLVIASYSITDERRAVVGQAGPYYLTGQQLLVKKGSDIKTVADIKGKEVCSVTGSTSLENVEKEGGKPRGFDTYSECRDQVLDGTVPAMSTDGSILLGYAAENPDEVEVVGEPFSEERYGVGYSKDSPEMCEWLNESLTKSFEDGTWEAAFDATLGKSGAEAPETPKLDPCPAG
jgi:glutamate transport system substrate-binding protein